MPSLQNQPVGKVHLHLATQQPVGRRPTPVLMLRMLIIGYVFRAFVSERLSDSTAQVRRIPTINPKRR